MANPKLDFFRFKLRHKSGADKTFREFMLESGKCTNKDSDSKIFGMLFEYFMNELKNDFAKNDSIKKVMTLISNKGHRITNRHWDERPKPDLAKKYHCRRCKWRYIRKRPNRDKIKQERRDQ